jgi:hypothetical protein
MKRSRSGSPVFGSAPSTPGYAASGYSSSSPRRSPSSPRRSPSSPRRSPSSPRRSPSSPRRSPSSLRCYESFKEFFAIPRETMLRQERMDERMRRQERMRHSIRRRSTDDCFICLPVVTNIIKVMKKHPDMFDSKDFVMIHVFHLLVDIINK